jgi:conjugative transfer signal peptidase TraF
MRRRYRVLLLLVVGIATAGGFECFIPLRIGLGKSMPAGLYLLDDGPVRRGDVVLACPPATSAAWAMRRGYIGGGKCPGRTRQIGKQVVAIAGDEVQLQNDAVFINGSLLPRSARQDRDSQGRPLSRVSEGTYRLAAGEVWLHGTHHPRSWDSRYFGPLSGDLVTGRLSPIWVFESLDYGGAR